MARAQRGEPPTAPSNGPTASPDVVWGDGRVFVTPAAGCPARCEFCYLAAVGLDRPPAWVAPAQFVSPRSVTTDRRFRPGREGTVISLGCLSECLARHAFARTLQFLEGVAGVQNPVQVATRWALQGHELSRLVLALKTCRGVVFHSLSEIGERRLELGTPSWRRRLQFMRQLAAAGVPSVLYVKPYLPGRPLGFVERIAALAHELRTAHVVLGPTYVDRLTEARLRSHGIRLVAGHSYIQRGFPVSGESPRESPVPAEVRTARRALENGGFRVFHHSIAALRDLMNEVT